MTLGAQPTPALHRPPFVAAALIVLLLGGASADAQEIWFAPRAPHPAIIGPTGWNELFTPDAPWPDVAHRTDVFGIDLNYFEHVADDDLRDRLADLNRRGIALALMIQPVAVLADGCGRGVEGYYDPHLTAEDAEKLKRAGARVRYVAMDGALTFGRYYAGPNGCKGAPEEIARRVALTLDRIVQLFPGAVIGDIESSSLVLNPAFAGDFRTWTQAFEAAMHRRLDFVTLDVAWPDPAWPEHVQRWERLAHGQGLRFGVIYNGDGLDTGGATWISHAISNFAQIEGGMGIVPDLAMFAGWDRYPTHLLPETDPTAMTYAVNRYLLPRSRIVVNQTGPGLTGTLLDSTSQPVPDAPLVLEAAGVGPAGPLPVRSWAGSVPADARSAIIGLRVNLECGCTPAPNDFRIGPLSYRETAPGTHTTSVDFPAAPEHASGRSPGGARVTTEQQAGHTVAHVVTTDTETLLWNSATFPVTPGAPGRLDVQIGTATAHGLAGNAVLIWLDAAGKGVGREFVMDPSDRTPAGETRTDQAGRFTITPPTDANGNPATLHVIYPGSPALRPAHATVSPRSR